MNEAQGKGSFADLFEATGATTPRAKRYRVGEEVRGQVLQVGADGIFIDLGEHQQGFLPRLAAEDASGNVPAAGDQVRAYVTRIEGTDIELGKRLGGAGMSIEALREAQSVGAPVEGRVSGVVKGGVTVDLAGTRAFCPMSQLDTKFVRDASVYLQQTLSFQVTEIRGDRDIVLSRKGIVEAERAAELQKMAASLEVGATLRGTITRVRDFGAFVDVGGMEGLIPTRELTYDRRRPDQVVKEGDAVEVRVLEITSEKDRLKLTLSLKAVGTDPWDSISATVPLYKVIEGKVTRVMEFGAFVEVAPGIEGLLHVGELGGGGQRGGKAVAPNVSVGQVLLVVAQRVETDKRRLSLTVAPKGTTLGATVERAAPSGGAVVRGTVERVERFGVIVQLDGVAGRAGRALLREAESGTPPGTDLAKAFPVGSEVVAKLINNEKVEISIKARLDDEERAEAAAYTATAKAKSFGTFGDLLRSKGR